MIQTTHSKPLHVYFMVHEKGCALQCIKMIMHQSACTTTKKDTSKERTS